MCAAQASTSSFLSIRTALKRNILANSRTMIGGFAFYPRRVWTLILLAAIATPVAAQELRRIHYGTTTSTAHLPIWVAKDAGLFAKNGLNVEPVQIRGGALITMGIMSGQLQFSGAGAES